MCVCARLFVLRECEWLFTCLCDRVCCVHVCFACLCEESVSGCLAYLCDMSVFFVWLVCVWWSVCLSVCLFV